MPMDFIYQNGLLITLVVVSGGGLVWQLISGGAKNALSPAAATQLINREDAVVLDVRDAGEFASGHLPDARNIPLDKLAERIGELDAWKDKPIIVCCASGMRSNKACGELAKHGFRLHNLDGGVDAWVQAGYPLKKAGKKK